MLEKLQGALGVVHGFNRPIVGVVDDAAGLVCFDALALHNPVQRGFAVDHVVPCFSGNILDRNLTVVDNGGLVALLGEFHFLHAVVCVC